MASPPAPPQPASPTGVLAQFDPSLLATLAETISDGFTVQDREGRIVASNSAARRMLALSPDQISGRNAMDPRWRTIREDGSDFPPGEYPVAVTLATGEPRLGVVMGVRRPDESLVWIQINSQALLDDSGQVTGVLTTFADITAIKVSEIALRESEQRWRQALDSSDLGVWDWDIAASTVRFSDRALSLIGIPPGGEPVRALSDWEHRVHPDDIGRLRLELRNHWHSGEARMRSEFRVLELRGNRYRDLVARGGIVARAPDGRALRMMGTIVDVTEIKDAQNAAVESERRFIRLAEASPLPIWVSAEDGTRTYFNAAWCQMTGQSLEEAINGGWRSAIHADDLQPLDERTCSALAAHDAFTAEYRLHCAGGDLRRVLDQARPRYSDRGELLGYVGMCLDIEERYRAEREVAKLSRALEQAALSVVITDAKGRIEYANPACCSRYGYRLEELVGQNPRIFKSDRTSPETYADLWRTLIRGGTWSSTLCNRRRDGREVWESVTISPIRDEAGKTTHYVGLKEDVTDKLEAGRREQEMSRRMYRLERMQAMSTLVGGVAHDFNNILVAILGFSELGETLLRNGSQVQRVAGYLAEIRSAGERARGLVQQLLAAGRAGPISLTPLSIPALAEDMQAVLSVSMPLHPVRIEAALDIPEIRADAGQMHQVLINLLLNARDAMPSGGPIELHISTDPVASDLECAACHEDFFGPHLRIRVRDDGHGLSSEARRHLFEPFFTTKEVGKGTGLGLPVVDGIVHRHGGHIRVESCPEGGTAFEVYLPIPEAAQSIAPQAPGQNTSIPDGP